MTNAASNVAPFCSDYNYFVKHLFILPNEKWKFVNESTIYDANIEVKTTGNVVEEL